VQKRVQAVSWVPHYSLWLSAGEGLGGGVQGMVSWLASRSSARSSNHCTRTWSACFRQLLQLPLGV
jgi:hypothetical protein